MAAPLTIFVDTDALRMDTYGAITGRLYAVIEDIVFPEQSWSDFPVVVLGWWARECPQVLERELATFAFMDGSLAFSVRPQTGTEAIIEFTRDDGTDVAVVASASVEPQRLVDVVLGAAHQVLAACRQKSWNNPDIDELAKSIQEA